jgi:hypothetical protein
VRQVVLPPRPIAAPRTVIHIQDVHRNVEAQTNISRLLLHMQNGDAPMPVALEGGFGTLALDRFRRFDRPAAVAGAADYLLAVRELSGPLHAALTAGPDFALWGVDDRALYKAHVRAYQQAVGRTAEAQRLFAAARAALEAERIGILSPDLAAFDAAAADYHAGRAPLGKYVSLLRRQQKVCPFLMSSSPHVGGGDPVALCPKAKTLDPGHKHAGMTNFEELDKFSAIWALESSLDFDEASRQRQGVVAALVKAGTPKDLNALSAAARRFQSGEWDYARFYTFLSEQCPLPPLRLFRRRPQPRKTSDRHERGRRRRLRGARPHARRKILGGPLALARPGGQVVAVRAGV